MNLCLHGGWTYDGQEFKHRKDRRLLIVLLWGSEEKTWNADAGAEALLSGIIRILVCSDQKRPVMEQLLITVFPLQYQLKSRKLTAPLKLWCLGARVANKKCREGSGLRDTRQIGIIDARATLRSAVSL